MVTTAKRREIAPQAPGNVERLRKLYELSMTLSGDPAEVFARIAPMIGELLEVPIVCLSRIVGDELHFLSFYDRGKVVSNAGRYPLSVTPCATVEQTRDLRVYDRVAERFPDAAFLKKNNAVSYCGFPSLDNDGKVLAVTFLLDDRPHDFTPDDRDLLRVFGQRIGMEIERQKYLDEADRGVAA
ncbi:MAG: GAF domain-containing protein, partial [Proteobacteria bacterium]|nr:GAF domain-containing protein [Pseudomonadota bacterium]